MRRFKSIVVFIVAILILNAVVLDTPFVAKASLSSEFTYRKSDKLIKKSKIVKGKKHYTRYAKKGKTEYQIVRISGGKITLRPQKGWWLSEDPYFKNKKITIKLSSKCRFYYRNASYPFSNPLQYKRVSKKAVLNFMRDKDFKSEFEYVDDARGYFYTGGYSGDVYLKRGKVVAILTDGGD